MEAGHDRVGHPEMMEVVGFDNWKAGGLDLHFTPARMTPPPYIMISASTYPDKARRVHPCACPNIAKPVTPVTPVYVLRTRYAVFMHNFAEQRKPLFDF